MESLLLYDHKEFSLEIWYSEDGGILSALDLLEYPFHELNLYFYAVDYIAQRQEMSENDVENIKNILLCHKTWRIVSFRFLVDDESDEKNILDGYELTLELSREKWESLLSSFLSFKEEEEFKEFMETSLFIYTDYN